jgi:hypothetical protein
LSIEIEVQQLRIRVSELEARMDRAFAHLGLEADPLPGTKATSASPAVRTLIGQYQIIEAMTLYSRGCDGARDLTTEEVSQIFQAETGQAFEPKRAH